MFSADLWRSAILSGLSHCWFFSSSSAGIFHAVILA